MKYQKFEPDELRDVIATLPPFHRVAFAAACCERMLPNYVTFSKAENWGEPAVLRTTLDAIWETVENEAAISDFIKQQIARCELLVPDTEDFNSTYTSAALDAANAIIETLECCLDHNPSKVVDVATFSRDTVDMYIQDKDNLDYSDPLFEERILQHPLMIRELEKQRDDLRFLQAAPNLHGTTLRSFREASETRSSIEAVL